MYSVWTWQTLGFRGHGGPVYISSLVYASNLRSLEVTLQRFDGSVNGFGLGARFDIACRQTPIREVAGGDQDHCGKFKRTEKPLANPE